MWKNYVQSVHFIIMFSSSTSIMSGWDSMYDTASDNSFANTSVPLKRDDLNISY